MSRNQAQMQRRLGRLSLLIEVCEKQLGPENAELADALRKELMLLKEASMKLVDIPDQPTRKVPQDADGRR